MVENTKIEWADHTFNPWIGCTRVGPGCDHCYAETLTARFKTVEWGAGKDRMRTSDKNWLEPERWNKQAEKAGVRARVFCASLADVFDNEVDPLWRARLFNLIHRTPHLDWLLLTKRVGNVLKMLPPYWGDGWPNVWIGATVVNQEEAERDIPKLIGISAAVRFLSMEPLLGPVDLRALKVDHGGRMNALLHDRVQWVIVGGESGKASRPMHPSWAEEIQRACAEFNIPFLFKQWGEWQPIGPLYSDEDTPEHLAALEIEDDATPKECHLTLTGEKWSCHSGQPPVGTWAMLNVGKKAAGRELAGKTYTEFPADRRLFMGVDLAAGGDNTIIVHGKRRPDGSLEITSMKEHKNEVS